MQSEEKIKELIEEEKETLDQIQEAPHAIDNESEATFDQGQKMFEPGGIYLSGPILEVEDDGRGWREELIEDYGSDFNFRNPLDNYDPDEVEVLHTPEQLDENSEKEQIVPSEYIAEDKLEICRSQCMIVGLPHVISRGTCMEAMYAYIRGIPYFLWLRDGNYPEGESGWIQHHARFVSEDRDEVMKEIRRFFENYE